MNATKASGLYHKFDVTRTDGRDKPGGDRHGAKLFVLDYSHDVYAWIAAASYAVAVQSALPQLARELARDLLATARTLWAVPGNAARLRAVLTEMGDQAPTLERSGIYQVVLETAKTQPEGGA